ncbi:MAG: ATP-binding protein, partial [Planctomycetota bacterium]
AKVGTHAADRDAYGFSIEQGGHLKSVLPPTAWAEAETALKKSFDESSVESFDFELNGQTPPRYLHARVMRRDEDEAIVVLRDLTELKLAEIERRRLEDKVQHTQKLESLSILAGGVAHDFNNLLTGVIGNTSLALRGVDHQSPLAESLREIEAASCRAAELAKQMLAYSGKGRFVVESINLSDLLDESNLLAGISIPSSTRLLFDLKENIENCVVDITQIRQVLLNLVTNSAEALGHSQGEIWIRTGQVDAGRHYLASSFIDDELDEGSYVFFEVEDNGSGMSRENLSKIFDPFFTTKFPGRGLGLAAVQGIVRGPRGAIHVKSEEGQGACIRVLLPVSAKADMSTLSPAAIDDEEWTSDCTILVADDDESVRGVSKRMLELRGLNVITAADSRETLWAFKNSDVEISAVLLDMTMPFADVSDTVHKLREISCDVPIVLMSGYSEEEAKRRLENETFAAFLQKPFSPSVLFRVFQQILEEKVER